MMFSISILFFVTVFNEGDNIKKLPLDELIYTKDQYEGQRIVTSGYFEDFPSFRLFLRRLDSPEHHEDFRWESWFYDESLRLESFLTLEEKMASNCYGKRVEVHGVIKREQDYQGFYLLEEKILFDGVDCFKHIRADKIKTLTN